MTSCGSGFTCLATFSSSARQASRSGMWMFPLPSSSSMVSMNFDGWAVSRMMVWEPGAASCQICEASQPTAPCGSMV